MTWPWYRMKSLWANHRVWCIDGAVVVGVVVAAAKGLIDNDTAVATLAAVLLSHAPPQSTSLETAARPIIGAMLRVLRVTR